MEFFGQNIFPRGTVASLSRQRLSRRAWEPYLSGSCVQPLRLDGDFPVRHLACFLFPFMIASVLPAQSEKPIEPQKYELGPDSNPVVGVPEGKVTRHTWKSQVFEGTVRDYYLYVCLLYTSPSPRDS